jgi:hypothetical protein
LKICGFQKLEGGKGHNHVMGVRFQFGEMEIFWKKIELVIDCIQCL